MVSKNSLSKRIIALLLTAVLMLVSFPLSGVMFAFAADALCGVFGALAALFAASPCCGEAVLRRGIGRRGFFAPSASPAWGCG